MLSLETHLGVTTSPQAPFPTDYVTLLVSTSHRRFGSLSLTAEKGHTPELKRYRRRVLHSKHAQAASPPCWRATLAGRTIGNVCTPDLIGSDDCQTPQEVRVHLVLRVLLAGVGARGHASQAHEPHEALHPFAVDLNTLTKQVNHHAPTAVERILGICLVNQSAQVRVILNHRLDALAVVPSCPANAC